MRITLSLLSFLLFSSSAHAQDDAAAQAAQASQQAAMQANQQAMQDAMRANQEASDQMTRQVMQNLNDASQNTAPLIGLTAKPKISVKPGSCITQPTVGLRLWHRAAMSAQSPSIPRPIYKSSRLLPITFAVWSLLPSTHSRIRLQLLILSKPPHRHGQIPTASPFTWSSRRTFPPKPPKLATKFC